MNEGEAAALVLLFIIAKGTNIFLISGRATVVSSYGFCLDLARGLHSFMYWVGLSPDYFLSPTFCLITSNNRMFYKVTQRFYGINNVVNI